MAEILRDEYLRRLESFRDRPDLVKILTGVRRSGKSTILSQFRRRLEASGEEVVSVDMEAMSFVLTTGRDLYDYLKERMPSPDCAVLLDEVQYVDGWERAVNALRAGGADVYVTGSNAKVLSSEFSTMLAGRYAEIHVLPFSFREFLERYPPHGDVRTYARFEQYLRYGGLPIIDLDDDPGKNRVIMSGVYDSVVGRDIASRAGVELRTVERMTRFMYSNVGNITTLSSITSGSGISDRRTADRYLSAITDSYAFYRADSYDLVGKRPMRVKAKYYAADTGLRNAALAHSDDDASGLLENVVFLELKRRGCSVAVGSYRDYEVDFTVRKDEGVGLIQVCRTLVEDNTLDRELRPLRLAEGTKKIVLTMDRDLPDDMDEVSFVNLTDWLMS